MAIYSRRFTPENFIIALNFWYEYLSLIFFDTVLKRVLHETSQSNVKVKSKHEGGNCYSVKMMMMCSKVQWSTHITNTGKYWTTQIGVLVPRTSSFLLSFYFVNG